MITTLSSWHHEMMSKPNVGLLHHFMMHCKARCDQFWHLSLHVLDVSLQGCTIHHPLRCKALQGRERQKEALD